MDEIGRLSPENLQKFDDLIVQERILETIMLLRNELGLTIYGALDVFSSRYEYLRKERPNDFTKPDGEYGKGVYT